MKSVSKTGLVTLLTELNKVDQKLYELLKPDNRYPKQGEGWFFLGYHNLLNAIYYEFCGEREQSYYSQFVTCRDDQKNGEPIAWYKTKFSTDDDGSIKGPRGYKGFIPDAINDVILSYNLSARQKLRLLNRMFDDLKKLKNNA